MSPGGAFREPAVRLSTRRYRHIFVACLITLAVSIVLLALIGTVRWRGQRALQGDASTVAAQAGQQLLRALNSRRGTLTFIRDVLNRSPALNEPQLAAMGASAAAHTRHLVGTGLARLAGATEWWVAPQGLGARGRSELNRAIARRMRLAGDRRVPSAFVTQNEGGRRFLIMLEPLRAPAYRHRALAGVFDLQPLLNDFFSTGLIQHHPVQVLAGDTLLYRSPDWQPADRDPHPIVVEYSLALDAARWLIQMQPGSTNVARALSAFNVLLIGLSVLAGAGVTVIVWLLAARTWILQRAVVRRTAALRRTSERLRQLATTDELTGLYNRRFFLDRWTWEYERAKRYQRPLACLMVDVNGFKLVNDRLGHHVGDVVLQHVARELQTALRHSDILARIGGDEFIIALPETNPAQARLVADKLRRVAIPVPQGRGQAVPAVSLSVGMSQVNEEQESPDAPIQAADQALYAFKRRQRGARAASHPPRAA